MFLKVKLVRHHDINRPLTSLILLQDGSPVAHQLINRVLVATKCVDRSNASRYSRTRPSR